MFSGTMELTRNQPIDKTKIQEEIPNMWKLSNTVPPKIMREITKYFEWNDNENRSDLFAVKLALKKKFIALKACIKRKV